MARVEALANPALLRWARGNSGYTVGDVAKKIKVAAERIEAWEGGFSHPTITQLRNLGRVYRRPIAVFYLPEAPGPGPKMLTDYRRLWGTEARVVSPQLRGEIETAYDRRALALELLELEGDTPIRFRLAADLGEDPDEVARRVRRALGISEETQRAWSDQYAGFNAWRDATERCGALVLQMTEVPSAEARGFSLASRPLPAVVANIHDRPRARSFTLIHEFVHLALKRDGVCDLDDHGRVEPFCNHVAGAVLVPAPALLREPEVQHHDTDEPAWDDREIAALATRFSVSREVILRRLLILNRTSEAFYRAKREQYADEYERERERRAQEEKKPRAIPQDLIAVARVGQYVSTLILSNYSHGRITASDVADYFNIRIKHLPAIERRVFKLPRAS
jgi:Zn-dependent peptidase ImmA (M78 family)/transcriptional regulator with XRE-family HTH domain